MLQNIVASIDTKEASKLLERATRLLNSDDGHKLSLKQLLVGDSDSDEDEIKPTKKKSETAVANEATPKPKKAPAKKSPKTKPKVNPTPGTRRSSRLHVEPEQVTEGDATPITDSHAKEDDDDEDENQLGMISRKKVTYYSMRKT